MKGDLWPGIRGVGLTHKAPNDVDPGVKRLIIKVDLVKGSVQRSRTTRSLDASTGSRFTAAALPICHQHHRTVPTSAVGGEQAVCRW